MVDLDRDRAGTDRPSPRQSRRRSPWLALSIILVGSYAAVLNTTIVGVALPAIAADLGTSGGLDVDWVVTSFLIGVVVIQPATAWLADRWGRTTIYLAALGLFGIGAALCALAPNMTLLVVGRFIQGLGGGAVIPVGMATVYELFPPHRRGTALGVWGVGIAGAPAAGPPLGGWLVTAASWRWIFAAFVIVAAAAFTFAALLLRDSGYREERRLDLSGWALAAAGVALVVITSRQATSWGLTSPVTIVAVATAIVVLVVLVRRSLGKPDPIIDFRMFQTPAFSITLLVGGLLAVVQLARHNFLPVELQVVRGLDAQKVGLLLAPSAIGVALAMPLGGWLADRIGARIPAVAGLGLVAASMWQLAHLQPNGSTMGIVIILITQGVGSGLAFVPTTVAAMNSLPARFVAQASAVKSLNRQFAGAIGVAMLGALLVADLGAVAPTGLAVEETQAGYNRVFLVAFWVAVIAAVAALFLPGLRQTADHHAARTAEHDGTATEGTEDGDLAPGYDGAAAGTARGGEPRPSHTRPRPEPRYFPQDT